jgi:DNA polymerase-3 subunit gamma/tau
MTGSVIVDDDARVDDAGAAYQHRPMTYQVLARKYRPQTFHDVVGQDTVVQTLIRALSTGRIAHAFLFTGSRGVGKTTLARILARCLTCEQGPTSKPCGVCRMCTSIQQGQAVDVVEIDGASNNGVEQVRDLQEMARFLPQMARFKIFIIDEVHMLSSGAFNALLKTLEEPPPHLKFIFATTEAHKIPVTILSRCQRYDFRRIPTATIVGRLNDVLAQEKLAIDKAGLDVIARAAEGGMRDALSLTDQVLSFAGAVSVEEGGAAVSAAAVEDALGLIDRRTIAAAVDAVVAGDARGALTVVESAFLRGFDLKQLLSLIAEELRHISVAQATGSIVGFADLADDDVARIDDRARSVDVRDALRLLGMALDGIDVVANAEDARLALELVLLKMCRRPPIGDALLISEALVRLERLSRGMPVPPLVERAAPQSTTPLAIASQAFPRAAPALAPAPAAAAPTTAPASMTAPAPTPAPPTPAPTPAAPAPPASINADGEDEPVIAMPSTPPVPAVEEEGGDDDDDAIAPVAQAQGQGQGQGQQAVVDVEEEDDVDPLQGFELPGVDARWRSFVASLQRSRGGTFRLGRLKQIDGDVAEVAFPTAHAVDDATRLGGEAEILQKLERAFGKKLTLKVGKGDDGAPSVHEAEETLKKELQARLEAHAKAHPIVQKALSLFGGEVRAVRRS